MMGNVTEIPIAKDELAASVEHIKRNINNFVEHGKLIAKIRRQTYLAYIAEGFTEEQALKLCAESITL